VHEPGLLSNLVSLAILQSCLLHFLMVVDDDRLEIVRTGKEQLKVVDDIELQEGGRGLMRPEHVAATHEGFEGQGYPIILLHLLLAYVSLGVSLELGLLKEVIYEHLYQFCALRYLLYLNRLLLLGGLLFLVCTATIMPLALLLSR
jgi:hypothetical protein